ncbi:MAG TPA: hypothetical protein VD769_00355 [Gaiellaceae bacterium]|nr:hypothetical protein [Gaiellaceae bacterium]
MDAAPGVFRLGEDGIAVVLVAESAAPEALEAACSCPMGAIAVYDAEGREAA